MNMKACLNLKVLGFLAAGAVGVFVFAPHLVAAALPLLVLAICPLSMLAMMWAMRGSHAGGTSASGCHQTDAQEPASGNTELDALRAQVAELERRLAAEAHPAHTSAEA